jgi:CDP-glycerol glycerophosphotransferase
VFVEQIKLIISIFLYSIANIIPKNKNIWVFGGWFGLKYSDNPRKMFEFVNANSDEVRPIWIAKNKKVVNEIRSLGYEAYYHLSIWGLWFQLRASFVFVCQSVYADLFAPSVGRRTTTIQLWHGIPLKKIMFDVFAKKPKEDNLKRKIVDYFSDFDAHRDDYVIATSVLTQSILSNAFKVPVEHTLITGFPRNDVFFEKEENIIENAPFRCIYMPTFRGDKGAECNLFQPYGFDFEVIEGELIKHNIQLVLRMHPVNIPPESLVKQIKTSENISFDNGGDIYESISGYDCLITDYSSIYFDFLLSNNPIIFAPFDLKSYKERERSLYFDFPEVTLTPYCLNWSEVIERLVNIRNEGTTQEYNSKYQNLKSRFHDSTGKQTVTFSQQLFDKVQKL